jgi:arylsulfatase A-like enzyme
MFRKTLFWVIAATIAASAYYAFTLQQQREAVFDIRPVGTADDIAALSKRDDVNLLYILLDTLRADRVGCYGYERDTSPTMDFLASGGVRFARHLSQSSWTKCSMASLWTGLYPARSGVTRFEHAIPRAARLPAEIFREAGFRTAGIFRNGWVEAYFGFDQGFEVYTRPQNQPLPASVRRENPTITSPGTDMSIVDTAKEFLRVHGRERWFLYLHFMDIHEYVYDESTAVFGTAYSDVYDNSILRVNKVLQRLMLYLREKGYLTNTLVVVGSDHGEAFSERGFEGHARDVHSETTEVPLILSFPFRLAPGVVVAQRTRNVDTWPTLLDLLGLPSLEVTDGRSRVPEILAAARNQPPTAETTAGIAHLDQTWGQRVETAKPTVAVSQDGFRYVMYRDAQGKTREQLFRIESDLHAREDVLEQEPETAAELRRVADEYLEGKPPWDGDVPTLELDEMQLNQLRALGYAVP